MKFALTYPPEFDGELHVKVEDEPNGPRTRRTITIVCSVEPDETPIATIRATGYDMMKQPIKRLAA